MKKELLSFRCPLAIKECLDSMSAEQNTTRSAIITAALQQMNQEVRSRDGQLFRPLSKDVQINIPGRQKSPRSKFSS